MAMTVVPAAERLTGPDIFLDASPLIQAVMAILILVILAELGLFAAGFFRKGEAAPKEGRQKLSGFIARLAGAAPMLGLFGMSYVLLNAAVAIANIRPFPPAHVIAPGFAEALALACLGLAAGALGKLVRKPA